MPSADDRFARITREQYNYARRQFDPVLKEMLGRIDDPGFYRQRIDMAGQGAERAFQSAEGTQERTFERYGANVTPEMRGSLERSADLSSGLAEVNARNTARTQLADMREETRMGLIGIGRETSRNAQGLASGIAQRESQREAAGRDLEAREDAARTQAIGTVIGLGLMAWSSRDFKEVEGEADREALAGSLEQIMLHRFQYIRDMGIDGEFVGPMAEDVPEVFRGPDGKTLNMYNLVSALVAGYQQQTEEIAALKCRLALLESEVDDGR